MLVGHLLKTVVMQLNKIFCPCWTRVELFTVDCSAVVKLGGGGQGGRADGGRGGPGSSRQL